MASVTPVTGARVTALAAYLHMHEQAFSRPLPATNRSEYNVALRRHSSPLVWLDRRMKRLAPESRRSRRSQAFSDPAVQFAVPPRSCLASRCGDDGGRGELELASAKRRHELFRYISWSNNWVFLFPEQI